MIHLHHCVTNYQLQIGDHQLGCFQWLLLLVPCCYCCHLYLWYHLVQENPEILPVDLLLSKNNKKGDSFFTCPHNIPIDSCYVKLCLLEISVNARQYFASICQAYLTDLLVFLNRLIPLSRISDKSKLCNCPVNFRDNEIQMHQIILYKVIKRLFKQ